MNGKHEEYTHDDPADREVNGLAGSPSAEGMSFGDVFRILRKHKWFILVCAAVGLTISVVYISLATPIYEASAQLRIDPTRASSLGLNDLTSASAGNVDPLRTESVILKSDAVAIAALTSLPDDQFQQFTEDTKASLAFPSNLGTAARQEERLNGKAPILTARQENLIAGLEGQLNVKPIEETQVVAISFRDKDPEIAATILNHVIAAYLRNSFESRYSSVAQVQTWLSEQLDTLKQRAAQSQKRLAEFQQQNNIIGTDSNNNTVVDRLRLLNDRLAAAQAERIVKEAQVRTAATGDVATLATLYPNIGLQSLQSLQASLYSRYAELSSKFGPNYPPLAETIEQRKSVDDQISKLIDTTRKQLDQEYQVSKATEDMLQRQFDQQTQSVYLLNSKEAEYAVLVAEASASRDLYDRLQYQLQQAGVTAGLSAVNTMVVTSARAPHYPVEPKKTVILAFGLVLGLFAGAASAFILGAAADTLQSVAQVESSLGLPTLAIIPHEATLQNSATNGNQLLPTTFRKPVSNIAEAFRALRNSMLLSSVGQPPQVVLVSSAVGAEGKSTLSSNYSVVLAQAGAKVLLIDADQRRPSLHQLFAISNTAGLSDLLLGGAEVRPNFQHPIPELPGLTVLTAGKSLALPSEALASDKFQQLMREWRNEYDFILLDSAPLIVVSDTLPIAKWADAVILVTRIDRTPLGAAHRALNLLRRTRARVLGVVVNDIPANGPDSGAFYEYAYKASTKG